MALTFDGVDYRTIDDIKKKYKVSAKTIKSWVAKGKVPEPPMITIGTRNFRHFDDTWCRKWEEALGANTPRQM